MHYSVVFKATCNKLVQTLFTSIPGWLSEEMLDKKAAKTGLFELKINCVTDKSGDKPPQASYFFPALWICW